MKTDFIGRETTGGGGDDSTLGGGGGFEKDSVSSAGSRDGDGFRLSIDESRSRLGLCSSGGGDGEVVACRLG